MIPSSDTSCCTYPVSQFFGTHPQSTQIVLLLPALHLRYGSARDLMVPFECSHAIVSSLVGPEYYVNIMSFVDKTQLEPGCSILLHNKVSHL